MADRVTVDAFAKVNFGLIVGRRANDGFHSLTSLAQSISWSDRLKIGFSDHDEFIATGMDASEDNLAWKALLEVRAEAGSQRPITIELDKQIAVAAGLAGGSADAAAVVAVASNLLGVNGERSSALAGRLGSDVPFCLTGGLAILEGRGERITPQESAGGFALGIVVPPLELATVDVYQRWDELEGPEGVPLPTAALPPQLRSFEPLRNDLAPAAESLAPRVAEWRHELASRWGRPVAMSGSGPALYAFFVDEDEAASAIGDRPAGARATMAAVPVARGWREVPGTLADPE
ncbi:MAG: hypothetical protein OER12_01580 [Acidimicrobiia bacterium]|nr:hypothetical protein [Acidimicrobiia bacterium]